MDRVVAVFARQREVFGEMLVNSGALGEAQQLHAIANAQDGQVGFKGPAGQQEVPILLFCRGELGSLVCRYQPKSLGVKVVATTKNEAVDPIKQLGQVIWTSDWRCCYWDSASSENSLRIGQA